jgi:hypothetical protein
MNNGQLAITLIADSLNPSEIYKKTNLTTVQYCRRPTLLRDSRRFSQAAQPPHIRRVQFEFTFDRQECLSHLEHQGATIVKSTTLAVALVCSALAAPAYVAPVYAQNGFQVPNLNPFKKVSSSSDVAVPGNVVDEPETSGTPGFRLPRLPSPSLPKPKLPSLPKFQLPKFAMPQRPAATGPSTWNRVNNGTRTFFAKTKTAIMPWTVPRDDTREAGSSSTRRVASGSRTGRNKRQNLMSALFRPQEKAAEIESVNDYLDLPRPTFE